MQPHVNDLSMWSWFNKILIVGPFSVIPEAILYPLDRLKVRAIARQKNQTSSCMQYKEIGIIAKEILTKESKSGLFYGIKGALDVVATKTILRFLTYDFILGRQKENFLERRHGFLDIFLATFASSTIGALASQPSEVLKIKVQLEPLGDKNVSLETYQQKLARIIQYHNGNQSILFTPGLVQKVLFQNVFFMTEIGLFFELRHKILNQSTNQENQTFNYSCIAGLSAVLTTVITHPLEFFYHRYVIRSLQKFESLSMLKYLKVIKENEGISGFYKGSFPSIIKNGVSTFMLMFILQSYTNYHGVDLRYRGIEKKQQEQQYKRSH